MATNKVPAKPTSKPQSIVPPPQEHKVRIPRNTARKITIMKFGSSAKVDFTKAKNAKIQRENNFKEFKTAYNQEDTPTFGAGSEFGKEAREEARRKKYGIIRRKYKVEDQPWNLQIGSGKDVKRFKGNKEGTIADNTSYYVFVKVADGAFEAYPASEWYQFTPIINYKYLNSDEAEEEFARRDKVLNHFAVMMKKRLKNEALNENDLEEEKGKSAKPAKSDLRLTELEDWTDDEDAGGEDSDLEDTKSDKKKKKKVVHKPKSKKKRPENSDEEAFEESDDGDFDDKEIDYISDNSSSGGEEADVEEKDKSKYNEKGVEEEEGLREMNESGESEDDEEKDDADKDNKSDRGDKDDERSESSGSSSESDTEVESALFMQKKKRPSSPTSFKGGSGGSKPSSRTSTPTPGSSDDKGKKRQADTPTEMIANTTKKIRTDSPKPRAVRTDSPTPEVIASTSSKASSALNYPPPGDQGTMEDTIRRYLMRKPMTVKDILQKFKSKKVEMNNEKLMKTVGSLLKKINAEKMQIKGQLHLFIKKKE